MPVRLLKTLDLPTLGLPASAMVKSVSPRSLLMALWQENCIGSNGVLIREVSPFACPLIYLRLTMILEATSWPEGVLGAADLHQHRTLEGSDLLDGDLGLRQQAQRRQVLQQLGIFLGDALDDRFVADASAVRAAWPPSRVSWRPWCRDREIRADRSRDGRGSRRVFPRPGGSWHARACRLLHGPRPS